MTEEALGGSTVDFAKYLGAEQSNMVQMLSRVYQQLGPVEALEAMYRSCLPMLAKSVDPEGVNADLFFFTYSQFYFSLSCYLRCHADEALMSVRKAMDAALTAYYLAENPGLRKDYQTKSRQFLKIKDTVKKARAKDPTVFPLAEPLLELYDLCSPLAHADFEVVAPHTSVTRTRRQYFYFHRWLSNNEMHYFLFLLLHLHWSCLRIFVSQFENSGHAPPEKFHDLGQRIDRDYRHFESALRGDVSGPERET